MFFDTFAYILFFCGTAVAYYSTRYRFEVLLLASVAFYLFAGWFDAALIFSLCLINWVIAQVVTRLSSRIILVTLLNIGILAFFKYRPFFLEVAGASGSSFITGALPLGISFYTFQMLAYHIDVARKETQDIKGPLDFVLFVTFFPQLIAGPIVRANDLFPQLQRLKLDSFQRRRRLWVYGLGMCCIGLAKKVLFADSIALEVDEIFGMFPKNPWEAWLGAILFSFQIYFDFSGYSDIAVGCAYLLGIRLPLNFKTPYLSRGPREFWQRWHITLSTWIRDYLYIPLGGARGGHWEQLGRLLLVMGIAGFWHGSNWTFLVWGLLWGAYIAVERVLNQFSWWKQLGIIRWVIHMGVVMILWVFFRAETLEHALLYLGSMFSLSEGMSLLSLEQLSLHIWIILGCVGLFAVHYLEAWWYQHRSLLKMRRYDHPLLWGFLLGIMILLVNLERVQVSPFIYFRF